MDKEEIAIREQAIIELIEVFSSKYLNEEIHELCVKLVKKLGRKRDVLFVSGKLEIWAVAIIHAIATINFLFEKTQHLHITVADLNKFYGTSNSTTTQRSKLIRDTLKIRNFDKVFYSENYTPSAIASIEREARYLPAFVNKVFKNVNRIKK